MVVGVAFCRHGVGEVARELPMQSERQRASNLSKAVTAGLIRSNHLRSNDMPAILAKAKIKNMDKWYYYDHCARSIRKGPTDFPRIRLSPTPAGQMRGDLQQILLAYDLDRFSRLILDNIN